MIAAVLDRKILLSSVIQLTEGEVVAIHRKIRGINGVESTPR